MSDAIEYVSFGGGSPSVALAILNALGEIPSPARLVVFADTGWEAAETERLVPVYAEWLRGHGMEFVTVQAKEGPLDTWVMGQETNLPLPVFAEGGGMSNRQCTDRWKIRPIRRYMSGRYGRTRPAVAQFGLHWGEVHRMRDPKTKRDRNRWPLIERRMTRQDCIDVLEREGLPLPPRTACVGCPFHSDAAWRQLAAEAPDDFERAAVVDDFIRERARRQGRTLVGLYRKARPLRRVCGPGQVALLAGPDLVPYIDGGPCDSGYCFT